MSLLRSEVQFFLDHIVHVRALPILPLYDLYDPTVGSGTSSASHTESEEISACVHVLLNVNRLDFGQYMGQRAFIAL